jgi:hypothetical protein
VGVVHQMWPIKFVAVRNQAALHSLTDKLPAAAAQIGRCPNRDIVVRRARVSAAVLWWIRVLAIFSSVVVPLAFDPADGAVVRRER